MALPVNEELLEMAPGAVIMATPVSTSNAPAVYEHMEVELESAIRNRQDKDRQGRVDNIRTI